MALARPEKVQLFAEGSVSTLRLIVYLTAAIAIAIISFIGTVAIALYIHRRGRR